MSNTNPKSPFQPRTEARILLPKELTEDQLKAGTRATGFLRELAEAPFTPAKGSKAHGYLPLIEKKRLNPTVLIDGRRGSGKSALLVTLLNLYNKAATNKVKTLRDFRPESWDIEPGYPIVPVGLVDLEPLPETTNLLLHLVGHLERVVAALEGGEDAALPSSSAPWQGEEAQEKPSRKKWREFVRVTTLGWDGPDIRKTRLDPEAYALEAEHGERHRMRMAGAFRDFLDALADDYRRWRRWDKGHYPLFLLAIDDADMNPRRTPELLSLVRKLHHPRLGFLMTGDSALFEDSLLLDLTRRENLPEHSLPQPLRNLPRAIYDKVIPPPQRCELPPISVRRRLSFPRNEPIQEQLKQFQMPSSTSLLDYKLLLAGPHGLAQVLPDRLRDLVSLRATLNELLTDGTADLPRTARALMKLWELAVEASDRSGSDRAILRNLIWLEETETGEDSLHVEAQKFSSDLVVQTLPWSIGEEFLISLGYPTQLSLYMPGINPESRAVDMEMARLPEGLLVAYGLANDFARTAEPYGHSTGPTISNRDVERALTRIRWKRVFSSEPQPHEEFLSALPSFSSTISSIAPPSKEETRINELASSFTMHWPLPDWGTHQDLTQFIQAWRQELEDAPTPVSWPSASTPSPDDLAWLFLRLVIQVSRRQPIEGIQLGKKPNWGWLAKELGALQEMTGSARANAISTWVQHLGLLAAPESGLSLLFSDGLINSLEGIFSPSWSDVSDGLRWERRRRLQEALSQTYSYTSATTGPGELENLLRKIDDTFETHPFTQRIQRELPFSSSQRADNVHNLLQELRSVRTPFASLATYFTSLRQGLLALNPLWLLETLLEQARNTRKPAEAAQVLAQLWKTWTYERSREDIEPKLQLREGRVVLQETPFMERFRERVDESFTKARWRDSAITENFHLFFTLARQTGAGLVAGVPSDAEPLLRVAHDLAMEQPDATSAPSPAPRWWHLLKGSWKKSEFWVFPAIAWRTLWEWEMLEESWLARLAQPNMNREAPVTEQVAPRALWLIEDSLWCYRRHGYPPDISEPFSQDRWVHQVETLHKLIKNLPPQKPRTKELQDWAARLPLLAAPESGLPGELADLFLARWDQTFGTDKQALQAHRLARLTESGHSLEHARQMLDEIDAAFREPRHPWLERVGPFNSEK
ncbi:hypothetical protein [Hyalangium rubrum]|uniref:ATP-binding protein n=1 Tax=Hyalangium rubrum TaxID=3103134 RepID=A0ABU5GXX4_9BACT|nr:hypothetical protein [Hyalangium sp. s54d21]MDY7226040.1 hypothetical protein [Hyalangium sp. s54d21]